ncbi:MAG: SUMF1/EgtB/PvdO family nonheme iron enzyme [Acidobacteria bacterium]|nr:SUMF1/EgtB/PvdO family nonheme iron enzyme [Acidobacteriota bacterium]NIM63225.1 SUMF1/EgtB/PvdO family nonheme iron enzyme [Acidobacteriota bacterium]NIO61003.1 SUMF1/EgtB/PvdO family nonheme iron enzyme [Acidobacteriota bacterium]NIQ87512.1 SUMF1/EgtB/PvdO family nonheme iron enzyme [Acidobacteriota bacterium]NIT12640.1 SUMF1/EgtB/PvdO family nonheme iron enzyme [Acidobacteriota bacterium]
MRETTARSIAACLVMALAPGLEAGADTLRGRYTISIDALANPVEGSPRLLCQASEETGPHQKAEWWIAFGEVKAGDATTGGCGSLQTAPTRDAYLRATLSTAVKPIREGPLALKVVLALRTVSGLDGDEPIYRKSEHTREFIIYPHTADAFVPLFVAGPEEQLALGVREVMLKLGVDVVGDDPAQHGVVRVLSDMAGADLLLDGGGVGTVGEGVAGTLLRNVPAGLHEVRAREPSGTEVHRVVRVLPGRTVVVDLSAAAAGESTSPYGLIPLGPNAQGYEEFRRARDGAIVVTVPAGEFVMGNPETERQPLEHRVYVSEFLIDKTGVTWLQYKRFAAATGSPMPPEPFWGLHDDHPAVFVTWENGRDYCEWAGGRLPTEAEREKAARGTDKRMYPWGDEPPDAERAVHRRSWGFAATDPVGTHPSGASPYGVLDSAGNVWEWCHDWYDEDYYSVSPERDPKGPATGIAHVVRGGSWDSRPDVLSCSCRSFGNIGYREGDFGFRCAMNASD